MILLVDLTVHAFLDTLALHATLTSTNAYQIHARTEAHAPMACPDGHVLAQLDILA